MVSRASANSARTADGWLADGFRAAAPAPVVSVRPPVSAASALAAMARKGEWMAVGDFTEGSHRSQNRTS